MKQSIFLCALLIPIVSLSQGGASCTDPIPIIMDGVCRNYTISSATGSNLVCTSTGTTPITFFSITANASGQNMLLKVTGSNNQPIEIGFYDGTSCTNGNFESASSLCLYDGNGYWSPAETFSIVPNKTYILRIKTPTTGTIQICGQFYTPPNNNCSTATTIGPLLVFDNNAANKPATGVNPLGLCADALENTAFYVYTVETTGTTTVSIENLNCDNNYQSNLLDLGYQVGVFTGNCSALTSIGCYVGVADAQIVTGVLTAGTKVYVALDGILGSNCSYGIRALNSVWLLPATLKYFTASKASEGNILKWVSLNEHSNAFFEVERSVDGVNYQTVDHIAGQGNSNSEKGYQYVDGSPPAKCFYRLKLAAANERSAYSKIIMVDRESGVNPKVKFSNIVTTQLALEIDDLNEEKVSIKIVDPVGRDVLHQSAKINSGNSFTTINTGNLAKGMYYLIISGGAYREAFPFLKF